MKILIVDDHPVLRDGVEALLRRNDAALAVLQAASADDAMQMLDQHADIDAIVLDLKMRGTSGVDAIAALARARPALQIIVLSSSEDPRDVRAAFAHGALGYVPKSASPHTLLSAIVMVLNGERYVPPLLLDDGAAYTIEPPRQAAGAPLTPRQIEVLRYLAEGVPNKVIADQLGLSEKTVKAHITAIFRTLHVLNRTQAAAAGRKAGLI
ncbi:two component LuxR family transcriptional regulator [Burkholderia multivorans]|uniref:response regulator n=1 Tax=Burkholderia multivorans TaxID=87883 RepID=UPI0006A610AE|nr:response regulator transcription factor [Burkholderia multivorans]KOE23987.1 LuxR family transcriptional regulator [Burkholderia multivorans R-20526]MBU9242717.1 response regulator transcription factor [Burkholderia multivorans]MBU9315983.1 response regulator transcription factor [Burkholderia multivorans]MCO7336762.1 response regulator transcription factor [Burkholderia multivorans]MCO7338890.1 response regulator transcription factor [Burkholderia multivorans]